MPIKFACEHCGQRLNVSSSNAGRRAKCPKCKGSITVPEPEAAASHIGRDSTKASPAAAESETRAEMPEDESGNPYSEFAVYDEEGWEYDDGSTYVYYDETAVDPRKVAVPRAVLYAQGILLTVVAVVCFSLGIYVGMSIAKPPEDAIAGPRPCIVTGAVSYHDSNNDVVADDGSVVIILPQDARPGAEQKIDGEQLRPGDAPVAPDHQGLRAIRELGGDYARANVDGEFRLQLPDVGKYFVLVLSRNGRRRPGETLDKTHLSQIGRYFLDAPEFLGGQKYQWRDESIRGDVPIRVEF